MALSSASAVRRATSSASARAGASNCRPAFVASIIAPTTRSRASSGRTSARLQPQRQDRLPVQRLRRHRVQRGGDVGDLDDLPPLHRLERRKDLGRRRRGQRVDRRARPVDAHGSPAQALIAADEVDAAVVAQLGHGHLDQPLDDVVDVQRDRERRRQVGQETRLSGAVFALGARHLQRGHLPRAPTPLDGVKDRPGDQRRRDLRLQQVVVGALARPPAAPCPGRCCRSAR